MSDHGEDQADAGGANMQNNDARGNEPDNTAGNEGQGNQDNFNNNLANPIPHLPLLQNLPDALKLIRKYDGRTNVREWIVRFETDLLAFAIPYKYACLSLDRFFVDDASNWWSSVSQNFNFDTSKDEAFFKNIWNRVVRELSSFFDHSSLKEIHKSKNKSIVFKIGDDPQQYVTQKLATLKQIDQHMAEERKLDQLLKGLPSNIQLQFSSQELVSVSLFLNRLRKYSQILNESQRTKNTHSQNSDRAYQNPSSTQTNTSQNALHAIQQQPVASSPQTCFTCNEVGHFRRDCPQNRANRYFPPRVPQYPSRPRYPNNPNIPPLMNIPVQPPPPQYFPHQSNQYYQPRPQYYQPRPQYYQPPQNSNQFHPRFSQNYPPYMPRAYPQNNPRSFQPRQTTRARFTSQNPTLRQVRQGDDPNAQSEPRSEN